MVSSHFAGYRAVKDSDRIAVVYATRSRGDEHTSGLDELGAYRPYRQRWDAGARREVAEGRRSWNRCRAHANSSDTPSTHCRCSATPRSSGPLQPQDGRARWLPCWRADFGYLDVPESFTSQRHTFPQIAARPCPQRGLAHRLVADGSTIPPPASAREASGTDAYGTYPPHS
jgi:hypothetical protein